jgi:hypothetical protein
MNRDHRNTIAGVVRLDISDKIHEGVRLGVASGVHLHVESGRDRVGDLLRIYYSIEASADPDY